MSNWFLKMKTKAQQKRKKKIAIAIIILIVAVILIVLGLPKETASKKTPTPTNFKNFQECKDAGFLVMESHPAQCLTSDGKLFVQETDSKK